MAHSSPNAIIWHYFTALSRLVDGIDRAGDESAIREDVALCVILAVTIVEAFLNIFFRVVVSEPDFTKHEKCILDDLKKRKTLAHKLETWPKKIFGKPLDFAAPTPKAFRALMERRNNLMHFTSSHTTIIPGPGIIIHGLADTSVFDTLTPSDAASALDLAEGMIRDLCRLRGIPEHQLPHELHMWTGKVPI